MVARKGKKESRMTRLRDWQQRGPEAAYFQREAQVNFWTVLGGLAAGALLTQIAPLFQEIVAGRWYLLLYAVSTLLIIVNSWVQAAWGSLAMRWRLTTAGTLVYFLSTFTLSLLSLSITRPAVWAAMTGSQLVFALLNQYVFKCTGAWEDYSRATLDRIRLVNWTYFIWILMAFGAAAQMNWLPSRRSEIIWGFIVLISASAALYLQHRGMEAERKELGIP